jgi:hypothetical protein
MQNEECRMKKRFEQEKMQKNAQPRKPRLTRWIEISPEWHDSELLEKIKNTLQIRHGMPGLQGSFNGYPGRERFPLNAETEAIGLAGLARALQGAGGGRQVE